MTISREAFRKRWGEHIHPAPNEFYERHHYDMIVALDADETSRVFVGWDSRGKVKITCAVRDRKRGKGWYHAKDTDWRIVASDEELDEAVRQGMAWSLGFAGPVGAT